MADKIVVMKDGRVEQIGTPLELYDFPDNQFVAGFIGSPSMNFLPGTIKGGQIELDSGDKLPIPSSANPALATEGRPVTLGIRPEHLSITGIGQGITNKVLVVEPTGAETQVFSKVAGHQISSVFRERHTFKPGETIHLMPDLTRSHLFDKTNGQRLK